MEIVPPAHFELLEVVNSLEMPKCSPIRPEMYRNPFFLLNVVLWYTLAKFNTWLPPQCRACPLPEIVLPPFGAWSVVTIVLLLPSVGLMGALVSLRVLLQWFFHKLWTVWR